MIIGITGTREEPTEKQKEIIIDLFASDDLCQVHHGDCVGVDAFCHDVADEFGRIIEVFPPEKDTYRAFKQGDVLHEMKPYIQRNHDIVNSCDLLIVVPDSFKEKQRSGTWATYRYAKKTKTDYIIIFPDGSCEERHYDGQA